MSDILERITPEMDEDQALGIILDELMARAESDVGEAIRLCAIPHWFNQGIIAWLRDDRRKPSRRSSEILARLTELTFVGPYYDRGWAYHEKVRDLLLERWCETEMEEERFRELSLRMAGYYAEKARPRRPWQARVVDWFRRKLGRPTTAELPVGAGTYGHEFIYHLLPGSDRRGFELFRGVVSGAIRLFQLSSAQHLLDFSAESCIRLSSEQRWTRQVYEGQLAHASACWDQAVAILEPLQKEELPNQSRAMVLGTLGLVYARKGEWDRAIEFYENALQTMERVGDIHGMAITWCNLGEAYLGLKDWTRVEDYLTHALDTFREMGDPLNEAEALHYLGSLQRQLGDYSTAGDYVRQALEIRQRLGDGLGTAETWQEWGLLYVDQGEREKALDCLGKALVAFGELGSQKAAEVEEQFEWMSRQS